MNSYDAWKEGRYETEKPLEPIEEKDTWDNLTEAYESGYEHVFHEKRNEIIDELWEAHEVLKVTGHGMKGRIESIIEKMM
jgi:hypothetical protein